MKPKISMILLDENQILDLICGANGLDRGKASMNINYVENDTRTGGSWIIQARAPEEVKPKSKIKLCKRENT